MHRAVGIVRVSQLRDDAESPGEQRDRIAAECERRGMTLVATHEELDVSGGTPLEQRHGLSDAVRAIEHGEADVIVAAYFDRLVRSLRVQDQVVSRVEAAGGRVLALDFGEVSGGSAAQWLSATVVGAMGEYFRRSVGERSRESQARAIARGVCPWPRIPPGYQRGDDGVLLPDPSTAPAVAEAFRLRADGATVREVRAFLQARGVDRSYHGVQALLRSRVVLGEIHFGDYPPNLNAHPAIVDPDLWRAVQKVIKPRGRRAKSDRLLARLGVLRCGTCDGRMIVGTQTQHGRRYPFYRCSPIGDCPQRMAVSAEIAEQEVVRAVRTALADAEGRASVEHDARQAEADAERAQADLDAAIRAFSGLDDEPAARERLAELRAARDDARARADRLGGQRAALRVPIAAEWERLTLAEQRAFIRATVERAVVGPGRGAGRIRVELFSE